MKPDDLIRQSLRDHATHLAETTTPPPAAIVYLRAERRARRQAAERAILPLRIMQAIGILVAVSGCAWVFHLSPSQPASPLLVACAASAVLLVILGCWTMLRASRTS